MGRRHAPVATHASDALTTARHMCTVEMSSGRVLYEKDAQTHAAMASTTKIITAITVIENVADLDAKVRVDNRAIGIEGTSIYLKSGEELTVRELLLGVMLRSGNDASAALALYVAPAAPNAPRNELFVPFCELMQATARKAGATDSSFKNPHGLDAEGHYTTARDLALISAYAMRNPKFAEIVGTKTATIPGPDYPRHLRNKNRLLTGMDTCVGVKTGFTKKAGRCFVGAARKNGMTVVNVVLNCGPMFEESAALMERAASEFVFTRLIQSEQLVDDIGVTPEDFYYPLKSGDTFDVAHDAASIYATVNGVEVYRSNLLPL